jgi:putative transposase
MPRANRYILPGYVYHLTHRCHNRSFLLRFAVHRTEYCRRLREAVIQFNVSLLNYCVTSNHIHLLALAKAPASISRFMHKLQGQFAVHFNSRKDRSGAFWEERYHATMVDGGEHLWNCLAYIDLNMVRAGVVRHPEEWRWCGYHEIVGQRQRYCLLDIEALLSLLALPGRDSLAELHRAAIEAAIEERRLSREAMWTESIAVGSESFVRRIAAETKRRRRLQPTLGIQGAWFVCEQTEPYGCNGRLARKGSPGVMLSRSTRFLKSKKLGVKSNARPGFDPP